MWFEWRVAFEGTYGYMSYEDGGSGSNVRSRQARFRILDRDGCVFMESCEE